MCLYFTMASKMLIVVFRTKITSFRSIEFKMFWFREGFKKKEKKVTFITSGGVSEGQLSLSIFFVPNALKIISRH